MRPGSVVVDMAVASAATGMARAGRFDLNPEDEIVAGCVRRSPWRGRESESSADAISGIT